MFGVYYSSPIKGSFISKKADVSVEKVSFAFRIVAGEDPAHYAPTQEDKNIVNNVGGKNYLNYRNRDGQTPLMVAAKIGLPKTVKLMLEKGADILAKDKAGQNVLAYSNSSGNAEVMERIENEFEKRGIPIPY